MTVSVTVHEGVGRLVLKHPPHNILTREILSRFRAGLDDLVHDSSVRTVLFSAEGKHFSAGADVGEHLPPDYEALIPEFMQSVRAFDDCPLPSLVAVQGRCLGGAFEVALAADLVVAAETAWFGQPEILLGVFPPAACALLPHRTSLGVAADLVFTGDPIDAREAERVGLVRRVVPEDALEPTALRLAQRMAAHSGAALRLAKRALKHATRHERAAAFGEAGRVYLDELMHTADALEGLRAFVEKRPPSWAHA